MGINISVRIDEATIQNRIKELAEEITNDFKNKTITLVCILKGGVMFMVDLAKRIDLEMEYDFMEISSYGNSQYSTGVIKINKDLKNPITGKHVVVVEDIIDTGRTLTHLINHLQAQKPQSLKVCALLDKPSRRVMEGANADYIGFVVPDEFLIGYGLDYEQKYRNLSYIGILSLNDNDI